MSIVKATISYSLTPGTVIEFLYGASPDYSSVNFQNGNDNNNISLHFNVRPHDGSTGNIPQLVLNTMINGKWGVEERPNYIWPTNGENVRVSFLIDNEFNFLIKAHLENDYRWTNDFTYLYKKRATFNPNSVSVNFMNLKDFCVRTDF
ncbi:MAG: hypothetical protein HGB06_10635 [Chlorobaculum sp.]|jgi:hypothetical protein|nr:hypothetical protein [Chlorobaculum sp.]